MLRAFVVVVIALVLAPVALAAPAGLRDDRHATGVALAGPDVLVMREPSGRGPQLVAVPRAGGAARTLLALPSARPSVDALVALAASAQRVAMIVEIDRADGSTAEWRVYSGPPSGPLALVRRTPDAEGAWDPALVDVDGDRVLLVETQDDADGLRASILDPASGEIPVSWASPSAAPIALGGPYAAAITGRGKRLVLADLATGAERAAVAGRALEQGFAADVAPDGRLVALTRAGVETAAPGEPGRLVPRSRLLAVQESPQLLGPVLAGQAIAGAANERPVLLRTDGSRRAVGPRSEDFVALTADARGVAWVANGCVRYAGAGRSKVADPCPAAEVTLYAIANSKLRGHHTHVPVRCVAAPTGTCRGTVFGKLGRRVVARGRFAVRAGRQRSVLLRVNPATVRRFRREGDGSLIIGANVRDGRVGSGCCGDSELTVYAR